MPKVMRGKQRMIEKGLKRAVAKCPLCNEQDALNLTLAPGGRSPGGALRWHCKCGFQGME